MTARPRARSLARVALKEGVAYVRQGALLSLGARAQPPPRDAAHVRVFAHGLHADAGVMGPLMRATADGTPQLAVRLSGRTVEEMGRALARELDELVPTATLDLIGHSLGGLVLRWLLARELEPARVRRLITLGTPHHGSRLTRVLPGPLMRQLRPGSPLLRALGDAALPAHVRALSIAARHDQLVRPHHHALLHGGAHLVLDEMGHGGLLLERRAHEAVRRALLSP